MAFSMTMTGFVLAPFVCKGGWNGGGKGEGDRPNFSISSMIEYCSRHQLSGSYGSRVPVDDLRHRHPHRKKS